jgi:glutathione synthase/RimK-type ligase-like ATP-grasp enzyme
MESSRAPIVLIGAEDDDHVAALRGALRERGAVAVVLDSLRFPNVPRIALGAALDDVRVDGVRLGRPGAIYLRSLYLSPLAHLVDVAREMEDNWRTTLVVFREKGELLLGLVRRWEALDVPIYNPLHASDSTRKPYQISRLAAAGLPVPETLWTNDPAAVRAFAEGRRVAYKPVSGGAATKELGKADLEEARLARLAHCPVTFQELLPGEDLRIYVLDQRVVAAFRIEVEEGALDYRQNERSLENVPVSPELSDIALRATREIGLRFTGMDLKRAADGSWRILEVNPSPMFLGFDQRAGTDILGALADALVARAAGEE